MDRRAQEQHRRDTDASERYFTKEWSKLGEQHDAEVADLHECFDEREAQACDLGLPPPACSVWLREERKLHDHFQSEERSLAAAETEDLKKIDDWHFGLDDPLP